MTEIHECKDRTDAVTLYAALGLFLKPIARINITIHYPQLKQTALPAGGKSVSSWELMEKLKALVEPQQFIAIKIVKNTLEFIRFEGDLESRDALKTVMARLEGKKLKLTVFKESLKILVAETKVPFPSRYDWDSFFRDTRTMNEMKPGERPDTIHFQNIPCKWFADAKGKSAKNPQPSEKLFRRVWEAFGEVRYVDIPVLDPYRSQMSSSFSGIKTFTFNQDPVFEAYVQYKDYMSFVKVMDALRGMFIMYQEGEKMWVANVKVNFDKSKHLTEDSIRRRKAERERLIQKDRDLELKAHKLKKDVEADEEAEAEKDRTIEHKIALEERRYLIARRKLEAIRLMDYLLERVKLSYEEKEKQLRLKTTESAKAGRKKSPESESESRGRKRHKKEKDKSSRRKSKSVTKHSSSGDIDEKKKRAGSRPSRSRSNSGSPPDSSNKAQPKLEKDEDIDFYRRQSQKYYMDKRNRNRLPTNEVGPAPRHMYQQAEYISFQYNPRLAPPLPYARPIPRDFERDRNYSSRPYYRDHDRDLHHSSRPRPHDYEPEPRSARSYQPYRDRRQDYGHAESYIDEMNRAYEKYFKSIALRNAGKSEKTEGRHEKPTSTTNNNNSK